VPSILPSLLVSLSPSFFNPRAGSDPLARASFAWPPPPAAFAPNHGPGTSGGGGATTSAETLRAGRWSVALRSDWTEYESTSRAEAEAAAIAAGEFDALGRAWVNQLVLGYGLTDELELGVELGTYSGSDFIDAEEDGLGGAESASADPRGLTDTWIALKWRVHRAPSGHWALLAGVKLPTGEDDETLSNGEELEPSSQPGSGAYDARLGLAFSRFLDARFTLDASALYTFRGAHDGFAVGDRADFGFALAYRLSEDAGGPHAWSAFAELAGTWLDEDEEDGVANENSGGEVVFLALGLRDRESPRWAFSLAPAVPILQDVNGEQVESDWRVGMTLTFSP
jgi:hypothetical protein